MNRVHRILVGLLAAYAATMTLLASQRTAEAWVYRHFYDPRGVEDLYPLMRIARDYGLPRTWMESLMLQIADLWGPFMVPLVGTFFLLGLGAALIPHARVHKSR